MLVITPGGPMRPCARAAWPLQMPLRKPGTCTPEPGSLMSVYMAREPSWQERQATDTEPTGSIAPSSGVVPSWSLVSKPVKSRLRFHNGTAAVALAPCGVWQNTQISRVPLSLLAAFTPVALRLCLVLNTPPYAMLPTSPSVIAIAIAVEYTRRPCFIHSLPRGISAFRFCQLNCCVTSINCAASQHIIRLVCKQPLYPIKKGRRQAPFCGKLSLVERKPTWKKSCD